MDLGLHGKTALVAASSKGLGYGIARALAHDGARVAAPPTRFSRPQTTCTQRPAHPPMPPPAT
jgi:NAD(P)-dependent dehydrogenase (short-subunit alcohol dehydrogenase family)